MAEEREQRRSSEGGEGGERRFFAKPKFCQFCADKSLVIDYKKTDLLRKYVGEDGRIRPRRQTGACARHQRAVAAAVKQARQIALFPFTGAHADDNR
ncbi:MAG: 30S ribosomal protein S18 [Anaerolineae bacterium]|nr:30S ribosomal protein S18 [Anaerolineales bacterium]RIK30408.1 MAG: 30S ribosomal protein S18 [Anaerolineae bacterium]WKZ45316.1 MAG: 30S ribosomal protein S18 [Anaerolineales bacterium]WKZ47922.1 MAG: 30S ribosomal protein S18 [Anaerolineales bacterium]